MSRRAALAELQKATITTSAVGSGLLQDYQSDAFIRTIRDRATWLKDVPLLRSRAPKGEINKLTGGSRIIRAAVENSDDGYRAGASFPVVEFDAKKIRLPWEITNDALHENIEGTQLEADLISEMTMAFADDLEDLAFNGDTAAGAGPDQAFLQIRDGVLKLIRTDYATSVIDGSTINGGAFGKSHFFEALKLLPNKYRAQRGLEWVMSPTTSVAWWEGLTDRNTASGDSVLTGQRGEGAPGDGAVLGPLGYPIRVVPSFPDGSIMLAAPGNFRNVTTWDVRRFSVGPETDAELAAKDKRFYVYFVKQDVIPVEGSAVVLVDDITVA